MKMQEKKRKKTKEQEEEQTVDDMNLTTTQIERVLKGANRSFFMP